MIGQDQVDQIRRLTEKRMKLVRRILRRDKVGSTFVKLQTKTYGKTITAESEEELRNKIQGTGFVPISEYEGQKFTLDDIGPSQFNVRMSDE